MQEIARNEVIMIEIPTKGARFRVQSICCLAYVQALGTANPVVSPSKLSWICSTYLMLGWLSVTSCYNSKSTIMYVVWYYVYFFSCIYNCILYIHITYWHNWYLHFIHSFLLQSQQRNATPNIEISSAQPRSSSCRIAVCCCASSRAVVS